MRYARSGDIDIAYQTVGDGPIGLVFVSGFVSHLDMVWEIPAMANRFRRMADIAPTLVFDKRGTGLSDRTLGFGSVADRMDDIRAVMDAAEIERAALFGVSEGGPLALVFAATYPERVTRLILFGTCARMLKSSDHPFGRDPKEVDDIVAFIGRHWGTGNVMRMFLSDAPDDAVPMLAKYERSACTPHMAQEIIRKNLEIDVRDVLGAINVPTLVLHYAGDPIIPVDARRFLAESISGARFVELEGAIHGSWSAEAVVPPEVTAFVHGDAAVPEPSSDRVLATVLFTDIVGSTEHTAAIGDHRWTELLDDHDRIARTEVARFGGRVVKTTGDGLLATFDGPARGIQCAHAIRKRVSPLSIHMRAGLHAGEVERRGDDISGLGVVIARRICDSATTGEVLTSRTVKDLVTGSGIAFDDRGTHALKGVPDDWQLFAVAD